MDRKTQIVVVGGGAGGLELVRKLGARYGRRRHDIILVEKSPTHVWKPLLHEVADRSTPISTRSAIAATAIAGATVSSSARSTGSIGRGRR
jgi:NADH dehydrogenase FAD-containing subunit